VADALAIDQDEVAEFWPDEMVRSRVLEAAVAAIPNADAAGLSDTEVECYAKLGDHFTGMEGQQLACIALQAAVTAILLDARLSDRDFAHLTSGARELLPACACWEGRR
jgi:hypothetical protein